jgi:SAM-dependent methyltransferase
MSFDHSNGAYNTGAAEIIVPLLLKEFKPSSVLDVGCGIGTWLSVFQKNGIIDFLGVDGDYVDRNLLYQYIDKEKFYPFNLNTELDLNRKFDILISLEVAEHIEEKYSDNFIKTLINHSDTIVFSAAIPYQVGENHVNEQWPSYWVEKFRKHNYFPHDLLRPQIWFNKSIEYWYRQNIIVFKKSINATSKVLDIVHPYLFSTKTEALMKEIQELRSGKLGFRFYFKICLSIIRRKLYGNRK